MRALLCALALALRALCGASELYVVVHAVSDPRVDRPRLDLAKRLGAVGVAMEHPATDRAKAREVLEGVRLSGLKLNLSFKQHWALADQLWLMDEAASMLGPDRLSFGQDVEPPQFLNRIVDAALAVRLGALQDHWRARGYAARGYIMYGPAGQSLDAGGPPAWDLYKGLAYYQWVWEQREYRWAQYGVSLQFNVYVDSDRDCGFWGRERALGVLAVAREQLRYAPGLYPLQRVAIREFGARPKPGVSSYLRGVRSGQMARELSRLPVVFHALYAIGDPGWTVDAEFERGFRAGSG